MDKRLVRTVLNGIVALLAWRNRAPGLLLSDLGAYVLDPIRPMPPQARTGTNRHEQARTGTKRLSTVLRSPNWSADELVAYLWRQADARLQDLEPVGEEALVAWDQSMVW